MNRQDYLTRIHYGGDTKPSLTVLSALQEAHLLSVPFENLDIHAGRPIVLDLPELFRKVVMMRRGGFCYELNGLFHWLLRELGFHAWIAMGRVYDRNQNRYGPEFDHMLNLVELNGQTWLVDVGFGDFSMHPLQFTLNQPMTDADETFFIERETHEYFKISRFSQKEQRCVPDYLFSTIARRLEDFSAMCRYHQTSPDSHFTQNRVCSVATLKGRITLTEDKLIVTENGMRNESLITNEQEFRRALAEYFNIIL
jgi:N-hydroxyarylamine O-acetyltransferase